MDCFSLQSKTDRTGETNAGASSPVGGNQARLIVALVGSTQRLFRDFPNRAVVKLRGGNVSTLDVVEAVADYASS